MNYIISQIICLIAFLISLTVYHKKNKKKILKTSIFTNVLKLVHYLLLNAYSGCITKILGIIRDVIIIKKEKIKFLSSNVYLFLLVFIYVMVSIFTYKGIVSIFPLIAAIIYLIPTWKGEAITVKKAAFISSIFWLIYDISILSITGIISHLFSITSILIALIKYYKKVEKKKNLEI